MKAPDKIYIAERNAGFTEIHDLMWTESKRSDPAIINVEYIRKDALLDWAKEKQVESPTIREDDWWQNVIKYIESL